MTPGTVVVGGSQAAVQLAASLRERGDGDPITIIDAQAHPPYQRPPLSKEFLGGEIDVAALRLRETTWYDQHGVTLVLGSAATTVRRRGDGGVVTCANGSEYPYRRLVLATGAGPRRLTVPGSEFAGVHYLRDAADALALASELDGPGDVVVIGGGFIGLEVAAGARKRGARVTVVEAAARLIGRAVGEQTSAFILEAHRRRGIDVRVGTTLVRFHGAGGRVAGVELTGGEIIPADVVVVGIGVIPRTELAEQLELEIDGGIVVDEHAVASDGRTLAIGDVATLPTPFARAATAMPRIRLESVDNAIQHARVAAATIVGIPEQYATVPWFWSNQGDLRLQMVGLNAGFDRTVLRGDPAAEKFSVLYYRGETLLAADCLNDPVDFMAVRRALAADQHIPPHLAETDVPLKRLVTTTI